MTTLPESQEGLKLDAPSYDSGVGHVLARQNLKKG